MVQPGGLRVDGHHGRRSAITYEELLTFTGPQPLWTVARLAEALDVSTDFIYQAVQRDEILQSKATVLWAMRRMSMA
jgi:hypothetical protein